MITLAANINNKTKTMRQNACNCCPLGEAFKVAVAIGAQDLGTCETWYCIIYDLL